MMRASVHKFLSVLVGVVVLVPALSATYAAIGFPRDLSRDLFRVALLGPMLLVAGLLCLAPRMIPWMQARVERRGSIGIQLLWLLGLSVSCLGLNLTGHGSIFAMIGILIAVLLYAVPGLALLEAQKRYLARDQLQAILAYRRDGEANLRLWRVGFMTLLAASAATFIILTPGSILDPAWQRQARWLSVAFALLPTFVLSQALARSIPPEGRAAVPSWICLFVLVVFPVSALCINLQLTMTVPYLAGELWGETRERELTVEGYRTTDTGKGCRREVVLRTEGWRHDVCVVSEPYFWGLEPGDRMMGIGPATEFGHVIRSIRRLNWPDAELP